MNDWLLTLRNRLAAESSIVRVTIVSVRGSAPRDPGTSMLVGQHGEDGSIGGGHLEWKAIAIARNLLVDPNCRIQPTRRNRFVLGAALGQCCGGAVELWFEWYGQEDRSFLEEGLRARDQGEPVVLASSFDNNSLTRRHWNHPNHASEELFPGAAAVIAQLLSASEYEPRARLCRSNEKTDFWFERGDPARIPLWIFGAGHVGRAVVRVLDDLPFFVHLVDSREAFCSLPSDSRANLMAICSEAPEGEIIDAPPGTIFLIMTHSHELDFSLCHAILQRPSIEHVALIGSEAKGKRFRQRLHMRGISTERLAWLTCPIGVPGINSKLPGAIAIGVVAQLLQWTSSAQMSSFGKPSSQGAQA